MQFGSLGEERFSACRIASLAEADIHQIAILINTSIEVTPLPVDTHIGFVYQPDRSNFAFPLRSQLLDKMGEKPLLSIPHRFVGELAASQ